MIAIPQLMTLLDADPATVPDYGMIITGLLTLLGFRVAGDEAAETS